ncbi:MAG: DUF5678 domain-containing protein [Blastocatellales bacterium]
MTLTITVPADLERRLEAAAKQRGIGKDEFVRVILEENLDQMDEPHPPAFPARILETDLPVRDRSREYAWLAEHRDEYDGQYVALNGDTLIAAGTSAKEVSVKARELGITGALILYVEGSHQPCALGGGLH